MGDEVRFDRGHKRDAFLTETFGRFVEWVPVCPEVECGLGTPRESMRLVRVENGVRLFTVRAALTSRHRWSTSLDRASRRWSARICRASSSRKTHRAADSSG